MRAEMARAARDDWRARRFRRRPSSARAIRRSATGRRTRDGAREPAEEEAARHRRGAARDHRAWASGGCRSVEIAGPGFINFRSTRAAVAGGLRDIIDGGRTFRQERPQVGRSRSMWNSCRPTRPVRCTSGTAGRRRSATRSRRCSSRPGGRSRASSTTTTPARRSTISRSSVQARVRELRGARGRDPRGRLPRRVHPRDRRAVRRDIRPTDRRRSRRRARASPCSELRREQDLDLQAFGVKFDVYFLESSLYTDGKVEETMKQLQAPPDTRTRRTARSGCARPTSATTRTAS